MRIDGHGQMDRASGWTSGQAWEDTDDADGRGKTCMIRMERMERMERTECMEQVERTGETGETGVERVSRIRRMGVI